MSKLTDSLLSGSSGSIGRLVVANVYGTEILKSRPRKRSSAPSPKQQLVQNRMKMCGNFIASYRDFAKLYYGQRIGLKSRFNQAMTNLMNGHILNYTLMTITPDYPFLEFSKGNLPGIMSAALSTPAAATVKIDWTDNSGADPVRSTDKLQILYLAEDSQKTVFLQTGSERLDTTHSISLPAFLSGKNVHVWACFLSESGFEVSTSQYLGSIAVS